LTIAVAPIEGAEQSEQYITQGGKALRAIHETIKKHPELYSAIYRDLECVANALLYFEKMNVTITITEKYPGNSPGLTLPPYPFSIHVPDEFDWEGH
jgi:hypothetical protein